MDKLRSFVSLYTCWVYFELSESNKVCFKIFHISRCTLVEYKLVVGHAVKMYYVKAEDSLDSRVKFVTAELDTWCKGGSARLSPHASHQSVQRLMVKFSNIYMAALQKMCTNTYLYGP